MIVCSSFCTLFFCRCCCWCSFQTTFICMCKNTKHKVRNACEFGMLVDDREWARIYFVLAWLGVILCIFTTISSNEFAENCRNAWFSFNSTHLKPIHYNCLLTTIHNRISNSFSKRSVHTQNEAYLYKVAHRETCRMVGFSLKYSLRLCWNTHEGKKKSKDVGTFASMHFIFFAKRKASTMKRYFVVSKWIFLHSCSCTKVNNFHYNGKYFFNCIALLGWIFTVWNCIWRCIKMLLFDLLVVFLWSNSIAITHFIEHLSEYMFGRK